MGFLPKYNELDQQQSEFLRNFLEESGHEQIKGFPGSGKTVLLIYAVQKIRKLNPNSRIIFIEFTHSLIKMLNAALADLVYEGKDTNPIHVVTYYDFEENYAEPGRWDFIICDEVQDIPTKYLFLMKNSAHRVVIGGDANQSIYKTDPKCHLPTCTPEEITGVLNPNNISLNIIHRIGKHVANAVNAVLPGMNILSGRPSMMKNNMQLRIWKAIDPQQEVKLILDHAKEAIEYNNKSVGVLLSVHDKILLFIKLALKEFKCEEWNVVYTRYGGPDYDDFNRYAKQHNIPIQVVARGSGDFLKQKLITITTYHSSKGLDFDFVFMPFCDSAENQVENDATLIMVAMTRCRGDLYITYSQSLNSILAKIDQKDFNFKDWSLSLFSKEEESKVDNTKDMFGF